ncbi:MAG: flippase-like domain-containing protein [Anaerolineae bacterium]|nr:flippase-like domain-containing protein [Gloeobacterales cyanobacterium ES-bin-313]
MDQRVKFGLKVLFSLLLLGLISRIIDIPRTAQVLTSVDARFLGLAIVVFAIGQGLNAVKWFWLGQALALPCSLGNYLRLYTMGMFLAIFLPGSMGGDLGRAVLLTREGLPGWTTTYSVLADRYSGLLFLLILSSVACLNVPAYSSLSPWLWALTGLVLLVWLLLGRGSRLLLPLLPKKLKSYAEPIPGWEKQLRNWPNLLRIGGGSLAIQAINWGVLLLLAGAMHLQVSAPALMTAYGLITLASLAPLSLNGLGIREGGYVLLLKQVGVAGEQAVSFGFLWFIVYTFTGLLSGTAWWVKAPETSKA